MIDLFAEKKMQIHGAKLRHMPAIQVPALTGEVVFQRSAVLATWVIRPDL